jgi:FkbM family methyltransferase
MLFFDIGANVGRWTVSNVNIHDNVIAVEPSPVAFSKLLENIDALPRSLSTNVICLNYAVHHSDESFINLYDCKKHRYSTTNKMWLLDKNSRYYGKEHKIVQCRPIKLDQMIKLYGEPDLIKIDVEGGEYECIKTLSRMVSLICFEWALEFLDITLKCIDHLYNIGFREMFIQFEDIYNFRPHSSEYIKIKSIDLPNAITHFAKYEHSKRLDWGMIWCK